MHRDWGGRSAGDLETSLFDSMTRSRAKRTSTQSAPWTHCQGSATTFSSSHWRAAAFSGRIKMIVP
jgi:hypothetical protein